jgi:hypothetical protein
VPPDQVWATARILDRLSEDIAEVAAMTRAQQPGPALDPKTRPPTGGR